MKKIILCFYILLLAGKINAQTESFDIASFIAPKGWQRIDSNGVLLFHDYKTTNGLTSFCQIFLYPSRSSNSNAQKNFQAEWANRVVKPTGSKNKPKTQTEQSPDGWTAVTGYADITRQGVTYTCMLVAVSGFGKEMSVLVNIAGQDYTTDVQNFLDKFELNANAMTPQSTKLKPTGPAATGSLNNYIYTAPEGWTTTQYPDGIVMASTNGENCRLTLWPMRPAGNNLASDASMIFSDVFKSLQLKQGSTAPSMIKGISPQGWEYYIVKHGLSRPGDDYAFFGFVFVAKLGNQLASISGLSKDPLVSSCFGLMMTDVWPRFFYSLQFRNWKNIKHSVEISKYLPGVWMSVSGTAGDRWVFAPNGRFAGAAAAQRYVRTSSVEIMRITDVYFGDGAYSIDNHSIQLTHDDSKNNPETGMIRIEQESLDGGNSWKEKLYLLRKSVVDGKDYEVVYDKQNN